MQAEILPASASLPPPPRHSLAFAAGHFLVLALNCRLVSIRIRTKTGHRIKTSFISGIPQCDLSGSFLCGHSSLSGCSTNRLGPNQSRHGSIRR